jgi:hypothetical protein
VAFAVKHGDAVAARVAHYLTTPFLTARRTPITLLLRMHNQAVALMRARQ